MKVRVPTRIIAYSISTVTMDLMTNYNCVVPLGSRRRFGPAPVEDSAPPQLAQPSPSAYPRPQPRDHSEDRSREQSPASNAHGT